MNNAQRQIRAEPTKAFFINMLVRDIQLIPAITDLVDNCLDGARRLRGSKRLDDLWVRIQATPEKFEISDNCGGIPINIAENYAFRFGRPEGMPPTEHSVGQFGVGMKRAVFKLGRFFTVESATESERFSVRVDVDRWNELDEWNFPFATIEDHVPSLPETEGTIITVTRLHESVAEDFAQDEFRNRLREELARRHQQAMIDGLSISVNAIPVNFRVAELLLSAELQPALQKHQFNGGPHPVEVVLFAGVAKSQPQDAGWNVYCNGRLLLGSDQTSATGWGWGADGVKIPRFHGQFAQFRGYAFFDSADASRLPWNTTKTGVDLDNEIYRAIRRRMVLMMRPVIDFLNRLDQERETRDESEPGPLMSELNQAKSVALSKVKPAEVFRAPKYQPQRKPPGTSSIQYSRPVEHINALKRALGVGTNREVGERSFDYTYEAEADDAE